MDIRYDHAIPLDFLQLLKLHQNLKVLTNISPKDAGNGSFGDVFIFKRWMLDNDLLSVLPKINMEEGGT